jgi:2-dehydropantoate 2-reductase
MRVLVYGAGAIGAYLGGLLAEAGVDVTLLARGAQHQALSTEGLVLEWGDGRTRRIPVKVCRPGETDGQYELVFVTLKSMQLADAAPDIVATLSDNGSMMMIQNGLPWWYFDRVDSPWRSTRLPHADPDGRLAANFDLDCVVGAVIYKPVMVTAPGRLFMPRVTADRLILGEIDNRISSRVEQIAAIVSAAGLPTEVSTDIRTAKWRKLMVNLIWNPLCALTQSSPGHIAGFPAGAELVRTMMAEGAAVAASVGVAVEADPEAELRRIADNFSQQPSMLQDLRAGRPLEWDAILNTVIDIAAITGVPVPTLKNIAACIGILDQRIRMDGVAFQPIPKR